MNMHFKVTTLLIFFLTLGAAGVQESLEDIPNDDWRERCREIVAGAYINDYDKIQQNQAGIMQHTARLSKMRSELSRIEDEITVKTKEFDKQEFSKKLTFQLQRLKAKAKTFRTQISDLSGVKERTAAEHTATIKHFDQLKTLIKPVFIKTKDLNSRPGSYGFTLQYKSKCPKYRAVCPLPKSEAQSLAKIAEFLPSSVSCKRYATIK